MVEPLAFTIDALASYRITRLLVSDGIGDRPRAAVVGRLRKRRWQKAAELVECPWCTGFWVALGVVIARRVVPAAWQPVSEVFALSAAAGLLASRVRSMDDTHDAIGHMTENSDVRPGRAAHA
jgi:hypothetical protein